MRYSACAFFALLIAFSKVNSQVADDCLRCICEVEGCDSEIGKCKMDAGSLSCGPYRIQEAYWIDCGKPGNDYETCTKSKACSETCVRAYMKRYGTYCTGGRPPTCQDYARIHNGGPSGCKKIATLGYWKRVQKCLDVEISTAFQKTHSHTIHSRSTTPTSISKALISSITSTSSTSTESKSALLTKVLALSEVNSQISDPCLRCICKEEGCETQIGQCNDDTSKSCGLYQIMRAYWIDCGKPGNDYETCTKTIDCSETCVRAYMNRYGTYCTGGRTPTCQDYARIHKGGPSGCNQSETFVYGKKVQECSVIPATETTTDI